MSTAKKTYHAGTLTYTRTGLAVLFVWLLWGDFCFFLMETVVPSIVPLRLKDLGAPNTLMGIVMVTVPGIINILLNPVISFRSDRHRGPWGRRIPFILFTVPFLVAALIGIAFSTQLGFWIHEHFAVLTKGFSPNALALTILGVMMTLFSFFNTFVNSVFWYLFNDVVPVELLARYMSYFRMVSTMAGAFYSFFIFKHAGTHSTGIFVGVALLYFFGFGLMCLNVKEGEYPPPAPYVDGQVGGIAALKTYGKECFGIRHYWFMFLAGMAWSFAYTGQMFNVFLNLSLHLSFEQMGNLGAIGALASFVAIPFSGWLADRYHPIRIVIAGVIGNCIILPIQLTWVFWQPDPNVVFYILAAWTICCTAPIGALLSIMDPPLAMRIFPRDRFGQFCSAQAICRSLAGIVAGVLVGVFLDVLTGFFGADTAYRLMPVWQLFFWVIVLFCLTGLYRSWKRHGGDASYVAPVLTGKPVTEGAEGSALC